MLGAAVGGDETRGFGLSWCLASLGGGAAGEFGAAEGRLVERGERGGGVAEVCSRAAPRLSRSQLTRVKEQATIRAVSCRTNLTTKGSDRAVIRSILDDVITRASQRTNQRTTKRQEQRAYPKRARASRA